VPVFTKFPSRFCPAAAKKGELMSGFVRRV